MISQFDSFKRSEDDSHDKSWGPGNRCGDLTMTSDISWAGKTVLITGGAGGMGQAMARQFASTGAIVVVADLKPGELQPNSHFIKCDVSRVSDCAEAIACTITKTGRLDLLINAAGLWVEGASAAMTEEQWDLVMDVNLKGTFFMCRHAIPELIKTTGQIINIASDAGLMGNAGAAIYCASKGGVVLLTKALALELAPRGVRVNAICPCDVETPMLDQQASIYGAGDPAAYRAALKTQYPQAENTRFANPQEIASFVFMVASPTLAPLTGAALSIDFGTTAGR
jgi:NAD(P)-dependent dehydrogenase (short-subunit alcohol dehydrogenase family)